eukprot:2777811-Rhodomonas_salina.1
MESMSARAEPESAVIVLMLSAQSVPFPLTSPRTPIIRYAIDLSNFPIVRARPTFPYEVL